MTSARVTFYKRWRLREGQEVEAVVELARHEIVPHYARLSREVELGMQRLDDQHVLAVQRWSDRASYDAAMRGPAFDPWWAEYQPVLQRWGALVEFVDEWEGEELGPLG